MKTAAIIKLVANSVTAAVLIFVLLFCLNAENFGSFSDMFTTYKANSDDVYDNYDSAEDTEVEFAQNISEIDVEWTAGNVVIEKGTGDKVSISEKSSKSLDEDEVMIYSVEGNELKIKFCKKTFNVSFGINTNTLSKELYITIPEKVFDSVDIETVSANVEISGAQVSALNVESVSGTVDLDNVNVTSADIENVSGNTVIANSYFHKIDAATVSSELTIDAKIENTGDFESVSGNITLVLPADSSFRADVETLSGNFTSDFEVSKTNNTYVCGSGGCKLTFESVSGNVTIKNK